MGRARQAQAVQEQETLVALQGELSRTQEALYQLQRPFKEDVLELLRPWAAQYTETRMRYKFLILRGGSQSGKSTLAKNLHRIFGWKPPFVQVVQDAVAADLKDFKRDQHGLIVFDNINSMSFVMSQRALIQANDSIHTLGQSATGIYSYNVWLHQIPIVGTVDHSAEWDSTDVWMRENMCLVDLLGPCFTWVASCHGWCWKVAPW